MGSRQPPKTLDQHVSRRRIVHPGAHPGWLASFRTGVQEIVTRFKLRKSSLRRNYWILIGAGCARPAGRSTLVGPTGRSQVALQPRPYSPACRETPRCIRSHDRERYDARQLSQHRLHTTFPQGYYPTQYHDLIACKVCHTYLAGLVRIEGNQLRNIRAVADLLSLTSGRA